MSGKVQEAQTEMEMNILRHRFASKRNEKTRREIQKPCIIIINAHTALWYIDLCLKVNSNQYYPQLQFQTTSYNYFSN